jgi:hypothetical protein
VEVRCWISVGKSREPVGYLLILLVKLPILTAVNLQNHYFSLTRKKPFSLDVWRTVISFASRLDKKDKTNMLYLINLHVHTVFVA